MTKVNLYLQRVYVSSADVIKALNSGKEFVILLDGSVSFEPSEKDFIVFKGAFPKASMIGTPPTLQSVLGDGYIVNFVDNKFEINCAGAWQKIVSLNLHNATYEDGAEGINELDDEELEDIGWHATEFDVKYRDLVLVIEERCDMLLVCNEIEDGKVYMFHGLGFVHDINCARTHVREYVVEIINDKLANDPSYEIKSLTNDQLEALEYFGITA